MNCFLNSLYEKSIQSNATRKTLIYEIHIQDSNTKEQKKYFFQYYVSFLTLISKHIHNLQVILRPLKLELRDTFEFKWTPELHQIFDKLKKKLTDCTLRLVIPNAEKPFHVLCDVSNYGIGQKFI